MQKRQYKSLRSCRHCTHCGANVCTDFQTKQTQRAVLANAKHLGSTNFIYYTIDIYDSYSVHQGMKRIYHEKIGVLKTKVDELKGARMVEPSSLPFASLTILVIKKEKWLFCIDYRKMNSVTIKGAHHLPRVEDILDTLVCFKYFRTLNLAMEYHQIEKHFDHREKTSLSTPF